MSDDKITKYNEVPKKDRPVKKTLEDIPVVEAPLEVEKVRHKVPKGGVVKEKKRPLIERLVVGVVGPNGIKGIVTSLYSDIIVPNLQQMVFDSLSRGFYQMIFRTDAPPQYRGTYGGRTDYRTYSSGPAYTPPKVDTRTVRPKNHVERYYIQTRHDAEYVLNDLVDYSGRYGFATVADYYEALQVPTEFTHNSYGWTHQQMLTVRVLPENGVYYLDLPRPEQVAR